MDLIYNRTQLDLTNNTAKGHYNYSDLNRVETATQKLLTLLKQYGYIKEDLDIKTNWNMSDIPTEEQMQRYLSNIQKLIDAFYLSKNSPKLPETMNNLDITKANSIEKILYDIDLLIKSMTQVFVYSGVAGMGQNRIWQQRFRRYTKSLKQWLELTQTYWNDFSDTQTWEDIIYD